MRGTVLRVLASSIPSVVVATAVSEAPVDPRHRCIVWDLHQYEGAEVVTVPPGAIAVVSTTDAPDAHWLLQDDEGRAVAFPGPLHAGERRGVVGTHWNPGGALVVAWELAL